MSNKIIKINRGDSYKFTVKITEQNSTEPHFLEINKEVVYFAILFPHQAFEKACPNLVNCYRAEDGDQDEDGNITIELRPSETRHLAPGVYYYTVKLKRGGNLLDIYGNDDPEEVRTIIERTKLIVNE